MHISVLTALHVLGVVIWIGGVAFVTMIVFQGTVQWALCRVRLASYYLAGFAGRTEAVASKRQQGYP